MNLELEELRSFTVLAEALHFGRAAERIGISQPALSKQIQRLEAKLGGPLLRRHTRGVELTASGAMLRDRALPLLGEAERTQWLARMAMRGEAGSLRIGVGIAALASGLPAVLLQFRKRYPEVHVTVRDMSSPDQIAALENKDIDVGFVRLPVEAAGIEVKPLIEERLEVVANAEMARGMGRGLRGLSEAPFVVLSRATSASYADHVLATCRAAGFVPRIVQEANQLYTVLHLVSAGIGVSLAPASARRMRVPGIRFGQAGLKQAQWRIGMAWLAEGGNEALVAKFRELAKVHFKRH